MNALPAFATALAAATLSIALPAIAGPAPAYRATLAAAPAHDTLVAKALVWKCSGSVCASAKPSPSRPAIVCSALAKQVGTITEFRVDGVALSADALARCNQAT